MINPFMMLLDGLGFLLAAAIILSFGAAVILIGIIVVMIAVIAIVSFGAWVLDALGLPAWKARG